MTDATIGNQSAEAKARISAWRTMRKVAPFLWPTRNLPVRTRVVLALVCLAVSELLLLVMPMFVGQAVDALTPGDGGRITQDAMYVAVFLTLCFALARAMALGIRELRDAIFARVGQRAVRMLALETFRHIHKLSLRYHITRKTGGLSRVMERGISGLELLLRYVLLLIGPMILELILLCIVLLVFFGFWYFFVVVMMTCLYLLFTFKVTEWRVQINKEMNDQDTDANQRAVDSLLNYETVKYFGAEDREVRRYDMSMRKYEQAAVKMSHSLAAMHFGQAVVVSVGTATVMVLAVWEVYIDDLTPGGFVAVQVYLAVLSAPLHYVGAAYKDIRQSLMDMSDLFDLLEERYEISDKPEARELVVHGGRIVFENVKFGYDQNHPKFTGINLTIEPGQTVAIVGPSGSGKSTLGRLLFRFYDVSGGALKIDGQDVRDVTRNSLHVQLGVVPQDTVLFNESIYYNIAYGLPDARPEQVEEVARRAQLHDFINSLPDGYYTQVGERGLKLSGGEKQRVGIARMLLEESTDPLARRSHFELGLGDRKGDTGEFRSNGRGSNGHRDSAQTFNHSGFRPDRRSRRRAHR